MSDQTPPTPSPETQAMLDCLRLAVTKTLDRKRRLGQYAVLWSEGAPIAVGEDAPVQLATRKVLRIEQNDNLSCALPVLRRRCQFQWQSSVQEAA